VQPVNLQGITTVTGLEIDNLGPTINSLTRANNSIEIPVDTIITIEFSESVDINDFEIDIFIDPSIDISNYEWNTNNTVLTVILSSNLAQNTKYSIKINVDARDNLGNLMSSSASWSFKTWKDTDNDGIPNVDDLDDDNDGVPDEEDYYPLDSTKWSHPLFEPINLLIIVIIIILVALIIISKRRKKELKIQDEIKKKSEIKPVPKPAPKSQEKSKATPQKDITSEKLDYECPDCGTPISGTVSKCPKCGLQLEDEVEGEEDDKSLPPPPPPQEETVNHDLPPPP
jgi:hypothetical protein